MGIQNSTQLSKSLTSALESGDPETKTRLSDLSSKLKRLS